MSVVCKQMNAALKPPIPAMPISASTYELPT
jgi:hypothetical protein